MKIEFLLLLFSFKGEVNRDKKDKPLLAWSNKSKQEEYCNSYHGFSVDRNSLFAYKI